MPVRLIHDLDQDPNRPRAERESHGGILSEPRRGDLIMLLACPTGRSSTGDFCPPDLRPAPSAQLPVWMGHERGLSIVNAQRPTARSVGDATALLAALRRRNDEAQLTQILAAFAGSDPVFAGALAAVFVQHAPRTEAIARLGPVPAQLACRPEQPLRDRLGQNKGLVDLKFEDRASGFTLLVELKLGSEYGFEQLERYAQSLEALPRGRSALLAVTRLAPQVGESQVQAHPQWLGSVRWSRVFARLRGLTHGDPLMNLLWPQVLDFVRDQADFGPVNIDATALTAWARRDEGEQLVRLLLTSIAKPALATIRGIRGRGPDDQTAAQLQMYGASTPIWTWKGRWHLRYAVPAAAGREHRLRLQILAREGRAMFTVEARYDHPAEALTSFPEADAIDSASRYLEGKHFEIGRDREGYYWAAVAQPEGWLSADDPLDSMLQLVHDQVQDLHASGIFDALPQAPPTPPAAPPEGG